MPRLCSVRQLLSPSLLCCFPIVMGLLADAPRAADKKDDPRWIKLAVKGHRFEMEFARIPKGKFTMGSPKGEKYRADVEIEHEVEITRDYWLGTTEVTVGQFRKFVGHRVRRGFGGGLAGGDRPAAGQGAGAAVAGRDVADLAMDRPRGQRGIV